MDIQSIDTSAFTIDDIIGSTHKESREAEPQAERPLRTMSSSGFDVSRMLTFDVETGPDLSRVHQFDLEPVPEPQPLTPVAECPEVADFLVKCSTVPKMKAGLEKLRPCREWIDSLIAAEEAAEKPRKTAIDEIKSYQKGIASEISAVADRTRLLMTNPRYAMITSLAWAVGDEPVSCKLASHGDYSRDCTERELLELFWDFVADCSPLVGFNIISFDLQLICIRSAILGVKPSRLIDMSPYRNDCIDMYVRLGKGTGKCKQICKDLGIHIPAGDVDGSQAWVMYLNAPEDLRRYNISDVEIERELFFLLSGGLWV